jgi:hypothetical protein
MFNVSYDFYVRMTRDNLNQYIVNMIEIGSGGIIHEPIPFVFDSGATWTSLNKALADDRGWKIFHSGLLLGSYKL